VKVLFGPATYQLPTLFQVMSEVLVMKYNASARMVVPLSAEARTVSANPTRQFLMVGPPSVQTLAAMEGGKSPAAAGTLAIEAIMRERRSSVKTFLGYFDRRPTKGAIETSNSIINSPGGAPALPIGKPDSN
jgi:hypothetical protein